MRCSLPAFSARRDAAGPATGGIARLDSPDGADALALTFAQRVAPASFIYLADLPARPEQGDEATVNGETYTVFQVMTDPTGGAWLALREAYAKD